MTRLIILASSMVFAAVPSFAASDALVNVSASIWDKSA